MIRICLLIVCVVVTPLGAAQSDPRRADAGKRIAAVLPKPSVNQGKVGVYAATTSRAGYNYYVGVPKAVSETNPAGIHVFFHGLGGQAMARDFMLWAEFLKLTNCIGINMEYTDGNPHEDMDGKAEAAREAVLQVTADYPVIPGLGAITAFSAGGSPAGRLIFTYGKQAKQRGLDWPFCQVNCFGSGLNCGSEITPLPMSWFRAMGEGEQQMAPGLFQHYQSLVVGNLTDATPGACKDVVFLVTKGRGHTILPEEVQAMAQLFRRSSLVNAPVVAKHRFPAAKLAPALEAANHGRLGEAVQALARLSGVEGAAALRTAIDTRINAQVALCRELAVTDPILASWYADTCKRQLGNLPAAKAIDAAAAQVVGKNASAWREARTRWEQSMSNLFQPQGIMLKADSVPYLQGVQKLAGEESTIACMVRKFLAFAPPNPPSESGRAKH